MCLVSLVRPGRRRVRHARVRAQRAKPAPPATRIATSMQEAPPAICRSPRALAPNAGLAATGSRQAGQIQVWSTTVRGSFRRSPEQLPGVDRRPRVLADGRALASLGRARESAVRLWRFDDRAGSGEWVEAARVAGGPLSRARFDPPRGRPRRAVRATRLVVDVASSHGRWPPGQPAQGSVDDLRPVRGRASGW